MGQTMLTASPHGERALQLRRAARFTAAAGTIFSTLTLLSFLLLPRFPGANATQPEIDRYMSETSTSLITFVALYLMPFACIAFVWFIVSLRMWIPQRSVRRVDVALSNVQLVSGIVFLVLFSASAAAMSISAIVVRQDDGTLDQVASYGFLQYGNSLFFVFAIRMGAMFVFSTSGIGKQTGVLPMWVTYLGYTVGLVMLLSASFNRTLIFVFPVWTLLISTIIWMHSRQLATARLAAMDVAGSSSKPEADSAAQPSTPAVMAARRDPSHSRGETDA